MKHTDKAVPVVSSVTKRLGFGDIDVCRDKNHTGWIACGDASLTCVNRNWQREWLLTTDESPYRFESYHKCAVKTEALK